MGANSALIFGIIINVAILLVFFRFLMQLAAVSPYNPVVLSTVKATKIVDVFGRIFPTMGKGQVNTAALALLVVLYLLKIFGMMYLVWWHAEWSCAFAHSDFCHHDAGFDPFLSLFDFRYDYIKLGGDVYSVSFALY